MTDYPPSSPSSTDSDEAAVTTAGDDNPFDDGTRCGSRMRSIFHTSFECVHFRRFRCFRCCLDQAL